MTQLHLVPAQQDHKLTLALHAPSHITRRPLPTIAAESQRASAQNSHGSDPIVRANLGKHRLCLQPYEQHLAAVRLPRPGSEAAGAATAAGCDEKMGDPAQVSMKGSEIGTVRTPTDGARLEQLNASTRKSSGHPRAKALFQGIISSFEGPAKTTGLRPKSSFVDAKVYASWHDIRVGVHAGDDFAQHNTCDACTENGITLQAARLLPKEKISTDSLYC